MKDKVVIITGANRGIGKKAAKEIANLGAKVYMVCRSLDSANGAKEEIIKETKNEEVFVLELDLASVDSINRFVASEYAGGLDLNNINYDKRNYYSTAAYKQSKQANRLLAREWARRLLDKNIFVYSMAPGWVPNTDLFREQSTFNKAVIKTVGVIGERSVEQGADTIV